MAVAGLRGLGERCGLWRRSGVGSIRKGDGLMWAVAVVSGLLLLVAAAPFHLNDSSYSTTLPTVVSSYPVLVQSCHRIIVVDRSSVRMLCL